MEILTKDLKTLSHQKIKLPPNNPELFKQQISSAIDLMG